MTKKQTFMEEHGKRNRNWQSGYSDGYNKLPCKTGMTDPYYTGFEVGKSDREEDDEAVASGDFDLMSAEEAREIYGDERDLP